MIPAENSGGALGKADGTFATTHWSVVLAAGELGSSKSAEALETLCRIYWYPLYAYVRRKGYGPHDAQDLTQDFFARLLDKQAIGGIRREGGKVRSFLLTALNHFLINEWDEKHIVFAGFKMPPPSERARSQMHVQPEMQGKLASDAGFQTAVIPRPSLPGAARGLPLQFVIVTDAAYEQLDEMASQLIGRAMQSGRFMFLQKDIELARPKANLVIDRDRAADLGISMQEIGRNLATLLGGNYVNRFSLEGRSYKVIPQVEQQFRLDTGQLGSYYLRTASGGQVPLASLVQSDRQRLPARPTSCRAPVGGRRGPRPERGPRSWQPCPRSPVPSRFP